MLDHFGDAPFILHAQHLTKKAGRYRKLSNNTSKWAQEIQDALYNDHEQLNKKPVDLYWETKDDASGNAVGRLTIDGKIAVPVFVEGFKMAPLDTFVDSDVKPHRISPGRLKKALFSPDMFDGMVTPQDERGVMSDVSLSRAFGSSPWEEGRRIYATADGFMSSEDLENSASLLAMVLPTATGEDLEKFSEAFEQDGQLAVNFHEHGTLGLVSMILNTEPVPMAKMAQDLLSQLPASVVQFRYTTNGQLMMKIASDGLFAPDEVVISDSSFASKLAALGIHDTGQALRKAASPQGLTVTMRSMDVEPMFASDLKGAETIEKFGHYVVKDFSGQEHRGWVFPLVYSLEKKAIQRALFVGEDLSVFQTKIAGVLDPEPPESLESSLPKVGQHGSFFFEANGQGLALEPVTIKTIEKFGGDVTVSAETIMGASVQFHLSKISKDLVPVPAKEGNAFLLPSTARFVKLEGLKAAEILVGDQERLTKMATNDSLGRNTCRIVPAVGGRIFLLQGDLADKMGVDGIEQYPDEAIFKLACMGLSADRAQEILKQAVDTGPLVIGGLLDIKPAKDILGAEKRAAIMQTLATLPQLRRDTLKLAADIKDPAILDRVLSLNFLNPQNIGVLVDHMDDLEATGTRLSEMLLAARLGAKEDINENAIIQARQAIDDVLEGLVNLRSRLGPQTSSEETGGSAE